MDVKSRDRVIKHMNEKVLGSWKNIDSERNFDFYKTFIDSLTPFLVDFTKQKIEEGHQKVIFVDGYSTEMMLKYSANFYTISPEFVVLNNRDYIKKQGFDYPTIVFVLLINKDDKIEITHAQEPLKTFFYNNEKKLENLCEVIYIDVPYNKFTFVVEGCMSAVSSNFSSVWIDIFKESGKW